MQELSGKRIVMLLVGGLPACGKSTLCKKIYTNLLERNVSLKLFCYDQVMMEEHDLFTPEHWKNSRNWIYKQTIETIDEFKSSKGGEFNVIILDDNFYYKSMRHEFVQLCQENSIAHIQIILKCKLETCIERDAKRCEVVGEEIIRSMNSKFEYGKSSANENAIYMEYDTNDLFELENISTKIIELLPSAIPLQDINKIKQEMKEEGQRQNDQSFKKQLDESLRKKTSYLLQNNIVKKEHAKKLSELKKDILKSVNQYDNMSYYEQLFDENVKQVQ